jgi:hypothetical protein
VPYSTTHDHCGALKGFSRKSLDPVGHHIAVTDPAYGFALGDCACRLSRTDSEFGLWGNVIICAVLTVLSAVPIPRSHSESRTPRCGYADHHELELIAET